MPNAYLYVRDNPIARLDPSGEITVIPLWNNFNQIQKCKTPLSRINWDFHLDMPAPCDGYIIQQVSIACSLDPCPCNAPKPKRKAPWTGRYYEVWKVKKGNWIPETRLRPKNATYSDFSALPFRDKTCGYLYSYGDIRFYCENKADDPRQPPNQVGTGPLKKKTGVTVTVCGGITISSGGLPGSTRQPSFWKDAPIESGTRWHARVWSCCNCVGITDDSSAAPNK